jgi:hypothetical protein
MPAMPNTLIHTDPTIEAGRDRSVDQVWEVSKVVEGDKITRELAILSTYHSSRRAFVSSLLRHTDVREPGTLPSRSCMPFDAISVRSEPVARYSARALATAAANARAKLLAMADDPKVAAVFGVEAEAAPEWSPPVSFISVGF